jgi:hypothetical protein
LAESKQKQKDRERLAQLRADTSEVWNSPRVVKVSEPTVVPVGPEGVAVGASQREPRKTGWWLALHRVREFGFTSPDAGHYLLLPPEFDAILALETKAVAQIVLEVLRQTVGWVDPSGDIDERGNRKRRLWAKLGHKHFEFICGSSSQAHTGLKKALNEGYILRRPCTGSFEYSVKWREFQHGTSEVEAPLK